MNSNERKTTDSARDADLAGAEAALRRAARRAQQRAREVANASTERPGVVDGVETGRDPRKLTFSQAQGHEEIPGPLKLGKLPGEARTRIWNVFYVHLERAKTRNSLYPRLRGVWEEILRAKHILHDNLPLDERTTDFTRVCSDLRGKIEGMRFHQVFDLIQFVVRHPQCPREFISDMKQTFSVCRLAYTMDEGDPPTILPAATDEEGKTILESLRTLREAGLPGSTEHLRNACDCINKGDWAGSIRESIHTVESVARMLAPGAKTLKPALESIADHGGLHPALKGALSKLYGYTSNEQGVRHPLLDSDKAKVGMDEAVFMLGACASFASYLWRKHKA